MSGRDIVRELLQKGYAFPCACCKKMWKARARGYEVCEVAFMQGKDCGGLSSGMSFPLYEGPLTPASLATRCFRCGGTAVEAFGSRQQPTRLIGTCKEHRSILERLEVVKDPRKAAG